MRWLPLALIGLVGACVSNTIILESDSDGETDDDGGTTTATVPSTATAPSPTTVGTSTTTTTTATTAVDTGTSTTTTGPGTAVTTDPPPPIPDLPDPEPECVPPCDPDQVCVAGVCFDDPDPTTGQMCHDVPGVWEDCLNDQGTPDGTFCMSPDAVCAIDDPGNPTLSICLFPQCTEPCDCPAPPPTGDAPVACAEILGDGDGDCFLDCSAGQTCPDGMDCFVGLVCAFTA